MSSWNSSFNSPFLSVAVVVGAASLLLDYSALLNTLESVASYSVPRSASNSAAAVVASLA